jgi:signal transduction histidine kinase
MMGAMIAVPPETAVGQFRLLEPLQAIMRQVAVNPDLAEVFALATREIHQHLGYDQVAVHLTHPHTAALTLCAVAGVPASTVPPSRYYLACETSTPGRAVASRQSCRTEYFSGSPELVSALGIPSTVCELSVPILGEAQVFGALTVCVSRPCQLGPDEAALLALFAEQLAAAIRGAELFQRAAEREARETLLTRISRAINSSLDPGHVLAQTVTVVGEQLKVDRCTLSYINLLTRASITEHEYVNPLLFERRSLKRPTLLTDALDEVAHRLQAGEVLICTEQDTHRLPAVLWEQLSRRYGVRSLAWVPIPSQSQESFYTLRLMQATYRRQWTGDDVVLLHRLADQLAIALRNAELYDASQRSAAALRDKNTELETLVYTVSHDLQDAVASLGGFATLLQTRYQTQLDERGNMYVARMAVNANYLDQMLRHLLELSRVGRVEEPDEIVPAGAVVDEALNDLARLLAERKVALKVPPAWPRLRYSRVRLREVFSNLLSNAFKFLGSQPTPRIEIGWRRIFGSAADDLEEVAAATVPAPEGGAAVAGLPAEHLIEFFIKDNGIGIDPGDQQRIFLPFQRLEKVNVEGTGVGLSIVKRIIEGRGGTLRVNSTPGHGTTFFFTLPAAAETEELTPLGAEAFST